MGVISRFAIQTPPSSCAYCGQPFKQIRGLSPRNRGRSCFRGSELLRHSFHLQVSYVVSRPEDIDLK